MRLEPAPEQAEEQRRSEDRADAGAEGDAPFRQHDTAAPATSIAPSAPTEAPPATPST
jgi:hypothetical protein